LQLLKNLRSEVVIPSWNAALRAQFAIRFDKPVFGTRFVPGDAGFVGGL